MELSKPTKSRRGQARFLLRRSFEEVVFSLVPYEVWRDLIVSNTETRTIILLSQTCWGFKELAIELAEKNLHLALSLRNQDQIDLARKHLQQSADLGNLTAMFQLAYAYLYYGWGVTVDAKQSVKWLKKLSDLGNEVAMVFYAYCLNYGHGVEAERNLASEWGKKAFASSNQFALGICHYWGLGTLEGYTQQDEAFVHMTASAEEGNEFGQQWLALLYKYGLGVAKSPILAHSWFLKSAEQGLAKAQYDVACLFWEGIGCPSDKQTAMIWLRKAAKQGHTSAILTLEEIDLGFNFLLK